ncbi:MAG: hypothetical protein L0I29_18715 [Hyphomicrobiales bacterium]|nr:hypothetical protein [Hyphomicrobiales bacterium]
MRKVIEDRNARSLGERSEIYSAARSSVRKATNDEPAMLADADEVIEEVEASFTPAKAIKENGGTRPRRGAAPIISALAGGAVLGGIATAAAMILGLQFQPYSPVAAKLMQQYNATAPLVPVAVDYLHKVRDAVVEMQKNDPEALEAKAAHKFIPVATLDLALGKQFPKSMPPGSGIVVRADKNDYKVLSGWGLCAAARIATPEMIDPVRAKVDVLGCPNFGLWTPGAAKW